MKKTGKKITMQDLAKELNTTPATISRALNNSPQIGDEMKKKVKALAKKHKFQPNSFASNLRKGKSKTIGIIVPYINRHYFSSIIHHIEATLSNSDYNIMICQTEESSQKEKEYVEMLINQRVSGIIIALAKLTTTYAHINKAIKNGIRVIQVDNTTDKLKTSYIKSKNCEGAKATVLHLLEQGYRKIALFSGIMTSSIYQDRKQGYMDAHAEYGVTPDETLFFDNTNNREEGKIAAKKMLDNNMDFDAIFSSGDYAALGGYLVLKEKGIKMPQEVGIAGFANEHFAELISPSLTSSDQHSEEIGVMAAEQMLKEINDEDCELLQSSITPQLIIRESTSRKI